MKQTLFIDVGIKSECRVRPVRWAVFISGRGSNLGALIDMRAEAEGQFEVALVVSSSSDAPGLARAHRAGVPTLVLDKRINWSALSHELRRRSIERIALLGFMRIAPGDFCSLWNGAIFNLHPSLLPSYPGLQSIERAHLDGAAIGATVHEVVPAVDEGKIVALRVSFCAGAASSSSTRDVEARVHRDEQQLVRRAVMALSHSRRVQAESLR